MQAAGMLGACSAVRHYLHGALRARGLVRQWVERNCVNCDVTLS
jgi:hypothetical protein